MGDTEMVTFGEDMFNEHPNCFNGWSKDYATLIVKEALKSMNYEEDPEMVIFTKYVCTAVDSSNVNTEICYVETEQPGFFYLMRDMVDHINVVYNRWD